MSTHISITYREVGRPMPRPTSALPGTDEKLAILIERASQGQELWHPLDARSPSTALEVEQLFQSN
jgi:hypothetical protein